MQSEGGSGCSPSTYYVLSLRAAAACSPLSDGSPLSDSALQQNLSLRFDLCRARTV